MVLDIVVLGERIQSATSGGSSSQVTPDEQEALTRTSEDWSENIECIAIRTFAGLWWYELENGARCRMLDPLRDALERAPAYVRDPSTFQERAWLDRRRGWMATDWVIRSYTPAWLDLSSHTAEASALRELPAVTGQDTEALAVPLIDHARKLAALAARMKTGATIRFTGARYDMPVVLVGEAPTQRSRLCAGVVREAMGKAAGLAGVGASMLANRLGAPYNAMETAANAAWIATLGATEAEGADSAARIAWDSVRSTVEQVQESAIELLREMAAVVEDPYGEW
jgi:hypothetical protein